eukprot:1038255-Rhodomonas_salina.1
MTVSSAGSHPLATAAADAPHRPSPNCPLDSKSSASRAGSAPRLAAAHSPAHPSSPNWWSLFRSSLVRARTSPRAFRSPAAPLPCSMRLILS